MISQEEMLTVSDAGYAGMAARYKALMEEAKRMAARWVWYTDYGLDPRPLHFYLSEFRWPPGRPLRRVPKRVASHRVLYALDDAGHPLLARELIRVGQHPVTYYDTFFRNFDGGIEVLLFSHDRHSLFTMNAFMSSADIPSDRRLQQHTAATPGSFTVILVGGW